MGRTRGQSKRHSVWEVSLNVTSGMALAFIISQMCAWMEPQIQRYIWAGFIWKLSLGSNVIMTATLTLVSIARGYVWRRVFNKLQLNRY